MHRCAVIGDPVEHSLSPAIHTAAYRAAGLTGWRYDAVRVEAGGVAGFLASLEAPDTDDDWRGISVTAPHKREALSLAGTLTDRAQLAGAVNTLVRGGSGWVGDNTDLPGAVNAIRERVDVPLHTAVIIGGGATAASVGLALAELGVEHLEVAVRDPERAGETVEVIGAHPTVVSVEPIPLERAHFAGIVVATIPPAAQSPELVETWLANSILNTNAVFEVTYNEWPTPLVRAAQEAQLPVISGMDLLVHQAALQFEHFTGRPAPLAAMREAGEAGLAAR